MKFFKHKDTKALRHEGSQKSDYDYIIVGGGVAGLCAAIRLVELGAQPLVIEAGEYPAQKVCGEFIAPESIPLLHQWDIYPEKIQEVLFHVAEKTLSFRFASPAGALSHLQLDPQLAKRAEGATILTKTRVQRFDPGLLMHTIELSTGEVLHTPNVIFATGRIPGINQLIPHMCYMGIKAHFTDVSVERFLKMFFFKNAYLGVAPIEEGKSNVACIVRMEEVNKWKTPSAFMDHLIADNPQLNRCLGKGTRLFPEWMHASVPDFNIKRTPDWSHVYFIGDAAGTIPPATGNGLTLAIKSGMMVAEFAIRRDFKGFKIKWEKESRMPIFWGRILHQASLRPWLQSAVCTLGNRYSTLAGRIFERTR